MSRHTPSWELVIDDGRKVPEFIIRVTHPKPYIGMEIARINSAHIVRREEYGHLIAAAPEMLDALREVFHRILHGDGIAINGDLMHDIVNIISKAEGNVK